MAMSRADILRQRQEAAHRAARGQNTTVRRRCLIEGCPDYGAWSVCEDQAAANAEQRRHYLEQHWQPRRA